MIFDNNLEKRKQFVYDSLLMTFPKMNDEILKIQLKYMSDNEIDDMYYVLTTLDMETVKSVVGD